jgi:predicted transcriptional regulator
LEASKPKRNRFSQKHRSEGSRLAELLRQQRREFPSFTHQIDELINRVTDFAHRTRHVDQERVLTALQEWGALTMKELIEETRLSSWDLRQVLADLIRRGKVAESRPRIPRMPPAAWPSVYQLKG